MARIVSFCIIAEFFKDNMKQLQRGENSYNSGHVKSLIFDSKVSPALLKGRVQASMKNKTYQVDVSLNLEDGILDCKCTCPRGQAICHHVAALCLYAHHNLSATDTECSWSAPGPSCVTEDAVHTIEELYPINERKRNYSGAKRDVSQDEIKKFRDNLGNTNLVGFTWLLRPSVAEDIQLVPAIEDILFSSEYMGLENAEREIFLKEKLAVDDDMINRVANATIGQSSNEQWLIIRKHRLTASNFGAVLAACERKRFPPSLFRQLTDGYNLNSAIAVQWGKNNEQMAVDELNSAIQDVDVRKTGLWLDHCGYLGTSPDGLSGSECIVEVKCPYKYRNANLSEALKNDKTYIIYKENGNTIVNTKHSYYHQIQGQLHITKKDVCYLIVWTPNETEVVLVEKNEEWATNLDILKDFYMNRFIPFLSGVQ